jgi:hypothetical protein
MLLKEMKKEVKTMKSYLKDMEEHLKKAREIAYFFEESIMDMEENDLTYTVEYFEDAVARMHKFMYSPPRL